MIGAGRHGPPAHLEVVGIDLVCETCGERNPPGTEFCTNCPIGPPSPAALIKAGQSLLRSTGAIDSMTGLEPRLPTYLAHFYSLGAEATRQEADEIIERWRPFRTWSSVLFRVAGDALGLELPANPAAADRRRR